MFQPKLGLCALTFESAAWAGLVLGTTSDRALLLYLCSHAAASAAVALIAIHFLPGRLQRPRLAVLLFLFATAFLVPAFGFMAVFAGIHLMHRLPPRPNEEGFSAIDLPEIDVHQRTGTGFRQAGMRAFLSNTKAPVASRIRALVALQNISGRVATPLLRNVLTDPSEDIRLLAYGMLDKNEKFLNEAIHEESRRRRTVGADSQEYLDATRRLAGIYWELVYQELAQGDLRAHALQQSLAFTREALARNADDIGLNLLHGRLLQALGQPQAAREAYQLTLSLGMPKTRIVPYLAEVAYDLGDHLAVRALMDELGDWQALPRLQPVISYWSRR